MTRPIAEEAYQYYYQDLKIPEENGRCLVKTSAFFYL